MSPARTLLERAVLLGSLIACPACDADFSPHWQEQLEQLMDAGAQPAPPSPDEAGSPDAGTPAPPGSDAAAPQMLFDCWREYRCDRSDPGCPPLCLVPSTVLDRCRPGDCRADGFSPVRCEYCVPEPVK